MAQRSDALQNDIDVLYAFMAKGPVAKGTVGTGALRFNQETNQLFFAPKSKKNTLILLAEWVGSVIVIRNWVRDRGTYAKNNYSYSMNDYSGTILYFLASKPNYQNTPYIEVEGVIKQKHIAEAKLLDSTLLL